MPKDAPSITPNKNKDSVPMAKPKPTAFVQHQLQCHDSLYRYILSQLPWIPQRTIFEIKSNTTKGRAFHLNLYPTTLLLRTYTPLPSPIWSSSQECLHYWSPKTLAYISSQIMQKIENITPCQNFVMEFKPYCDHLICAIHLGLRNTYLLLVSYPK